MNCGNLWTDNTGIDHITINSKFFWANYLQEVLDINSTNRWIMGKFNEVINSGKTVLVDFSAEWCGPCKMMAPILKELASITGPDVKILKVDVDKNQEAAMAYQVQSVPTLIVFKNGAVKWRQSGVVPAQQLKSIIEGLG